LIAAYLFGLGSLSIGTAFLIYFYAILLFQPLEVITRQVEDFQKAGASLVRVQELLGIQSALADGPGATLRGGALSVEFDHVAFGYGDEERVVEDLVFQLEPGTVLGLLGRTGSGKTTISRLLFRLYDPAEGVIRLGGVDLRQAKLADVRRVVGMVTQDVQLFRATVRDNVTFFDRSVDDARIMQAFAELGVADWCRGLPAGLNTMLGGGGSGVSAGEAQLLAFTRVWLKEPGLVILDEASSRLDPATERLLDRAIDRLLRGRTGIIIAHRLATIQRADTIMILDDGRIAELGRRVDLAADPRSRLSGLLRTGLEQVLV
jgi:ATP-binding cassette subfamily B protein